MRVVVIGATGHIGTYLVPRLVRGGHDVVGVTRGNRQPYRDHPTWSGVKRVALDRAAAEKDGTFGETIAGLEPDAVVDLICFTLENCKHLVEAVEGKVCHFLHCGTMWVHGKSEAVPALESEPRRPIDEYGGRKAEIEKYLLTRARLDGFPATVLHPGHIVGPGWEPVNPVGNWDPSVFEALAQGRPVALPDLGLATLHHVHADDVAQSFERAIDNWGAAVGESFHVCSPQAVTLFGFATEVARWFGRDANLTYAPWDEWKEGREEKDVRGTFSHISHSPCGSIEKARRLLGYAPRYTTYEAVWESLAWLIDHGRVDAPRLTGGA